jgi:hypothetical protein
MEFYKIKLKEIRYKKNIVMYSIEVLKKKI